MGALYVSQENMGEKVYNYMTCDLFEIYFSDLNRDAQQSLLETAGIKSPEEANWDCYPIAQIAVEIRDDEEEEDE